MAINQLYRLAVECGAVNASGKVVNVFHYVQTSADVSANGATSLVLTWNAQMTASYVATFSTSVQYESLRARNIDNPAYRRARLHKSRTGSWDCDRRYGAPSNRIAHNVADRAYRTFVQGENFPTPHG